MSASNYNWVCFGCKYATRNPKTSEHTPKCIHCGEECFCLGYKVRIPKREDSQAWERLRASCRKRLLEKTAKESEQRTRKKHAIEKEIIRLESLGANKERSRIVKALKEELKRHI